ncbi:glycosyltransferase family 4 protein [Salinibacterium sp. G-O1]|uniref:glycosyltransferase family 4 protein n=1 Tax=Salinibacterium sp. G-O1 TaxID=3046208 RepID=UPI0024BAECC6|nr:glycosyltransferase family 4 protein [Salinibacterium sp. G-O1]MDJ0336528.1 glycosyltransferase family 4 protein [Salinibacterium sp. G-O1]
MRILVISDLLPPRMLGGFELACLNLSRGLRDAGHDVLILTTPTDRQPAEAESGVDRALNLRELYGVVGLRDTQLAKFQVHESRISNQTNSLIVLDRIASFRPDHVVMFNLVGIGGLGIIDTVNLTGTPWTLNLGDNVPGELLLDAPPEVVNVYSPAGNDIFSTGQYAIVSQTLADEVVSTGVTLGRHEIIPRGVLYPDIERTRPYRDGGHTRFVAAGVLSPHKGVDIMIDAAADLVDSGVGNFSLELYGGGLIDHYTEMIRERNLAGHVFVKGRVSQADLFAVHARSDAFLFPTWEREPGASAPFEAASAGCVPIMTANCGPAERMVHGIHALKIERNAQSLGHEMRRVISGEVDLELMFDAGRRLAHGDLSFSLSVERLSNLIKSAAPSTSAVLDFDEIAKEVIRKDTSAMGALYTTFFNPTHDEDHPEDATMDEHRDPTAPVNIVAPSSVWSRMTSAPVRVARRVLRPLVEEQLLAPRATLAEQARSNRKAQESIDARNAALVERELAADAREGEIRSLIEGMKKDLLATNLRVTHIEETDKDA